MAARGGSVQECDELENYYLQTFLPFSLTTKMTNLILKLLEPYSFLKYYHNGWFKRIRMVYWGIITTNNIKKHSNKQ